MNSNPSQHDANEPVIPAGLGAELRAGHGRMGDLSGLDAAVMGMARRELGRRTSRSVLARVGGLGWTRGLAAAAVLAIGVWGGWMFLGRSGPVSGAGMNAIAHGPSEHVTILDAFALARMLEARQKDPAAGGASAIPAAWDVDGNGVIDQRDVDAIAQRAVKLSSVTGTASPARGAADTSPERSEGLGKVAVRRPSLRSGLVNAPASGEQGGGA